MVTKRAAWGQWGLLSGRAGALPKLCHAIKATASNIKSSEGVIRPTVLGRAA